MDAGFVMTLMRIHCSSGCGLERPGGMMKDWCANWSVIVDLGHTKGLGRDQETGGGGGS